MPPGAKKNPRAKSKKALSVDFKRVKSKMGRKLPPAKNATKVEFKSKGIVISGQSITQEKDGLAVNHRKQTLKELLIQITHYSERMRKDAIMGLKDLFSQHPKELFMHAVVVIEKLSPRMTDTERSVRQALVLLLRSSVLNILPQAMMKPLVPVMMAHVCSAMTNLVLDIRIAACTFLDLLVQHCADLVVNVYLGQIVQHYIALLGKGGISGQPGNTLASVLSSLEHFLSALKQSTMPSQRSNPAAVTHVWGTNQVQPVTNVWGSNQGTLAGVEALYAYKSALSEGGRPDQVSLTAAQLVPVLLECWADYAPIVCNAPNPDSGGLECMVLITKCVSHIFQTMTIEATLSSFAGDLTNKTAVIHVPEYGSEEWETHLWMREEFLPDLHKRLLNSFPISAPVVRLPPKVEDGLVALNISVCEVMLQFIMPIAEGIDNSQLDVIVEYVEGALNGVMLPSSQFSGGLSDVKLTEPHVKSLISYLPGLVSCVASDWVPRLLKAFTHVFESCDSRSSTKMVCLASMREIVLSGSKPGKQNAMKHNAVPSEFQTLWLQSLPRLLWELKHLHPNVSQAVLEMLLYIGRSSRDGSALAESYTGLQQAMVPFFCTFLPSKKSDETRCLYGPFIKLPQPCQELASALLYYYSKFSLVFLKVLAQCCLCPDLDAAISVRIVETVHRAWGRGAVVIGDHLSFLFTLLRGHVSSSQGGNSSKKSLIEIDASNIEEYYQEDLELKIRQKHSAITGVVCHSLAQLGDGNLVLSILGPLIQEELESQSQLRVVHSFFRAVSILSHKEKDSNELFLPESLVDVLPKSAANFVVTIAQLHDRIPEKKLALDSLKRPCIILMARQPSFTVKVLEVIHDFLQTGFVSSTKRKHSKQVATVKVVLETMKTEKLHSCLSSAKDTIKAIMQTIEAHEDTETSRGRELKRLHEQLQTTSDALFGSGF